MDGLRERSEAIASECDVAFELYRSPQKEVYKLPNGSNKHFVYKGEWANA